MDRMERAERRRKAKWDRKAKVHECECCGSGSDAYLEHRMKHRVAMRLHSEEVARKKELIKDITADELESILNYYQHGHPTLRDAIDWTYPQRQED